MSDAALYICPMHSGVRQNGPGKCSKCGMDLVPEGTKFGLLRHMMSSPAHLAAMAGVMTAIMITAMMLLH